MDIKKLPFWRIALYSSASAGLNILAITITTWLLYFYAPPPDSGRPTYMPAITIGILLLVATIWDAVIDPFIGHFSDTRAYPLGKAPPIFDVCSSLCHVGRDPALDSTQPDKLPAQRCLLHGGHSDLSHQLQPGWNSV